MKDEQFIITKRDLDREKDDYTRLGIVFGIIIGIPAGMVIGIVATLIITAL